MTHQSCLLDHCSSLHPPPPCICPWSEESGDLLSLVLAPVRIQARLAPNLSNSVCCTWSHTTWLSLKTTDSPSLWPFQWIQCTLDLVFELIIFNRLQTLRCLRDQFCRFCTSTATQSFKQGVFACWIVLLVTNTLNLMGRIGGELLYIKTQTSRASNKPVQSESEFLRRPQNVQMIILLECKFGQHSKKGLTLNRAFNLKSDLNLVWHFLCTSSFSSNIIEQQYATGTIDCDESADRSVNVRS